jgi:Glycosyltransferase family 87
VPPLLSRTLPSLAPPRAIWLLRAADAAALYRLPVYLACALVSLAVAYWLGKDLAWDSLDYQLYAGFSAFNDRFAQDYFAAGPQSYLNPYVYAPFYALLRSGLSAIEIGALLTLWHSAILWLTFELAVAVCPGAAPKTRAAIGIWAVALALVNPILLQQIGSSFADITTAELVLGGWVLLATLAHRPRVAPLLCAAALLGAAAALKLTNAMHAIGGAAVLLMLPLPLRGKIRYGLLYAVTVGLAFALVTAPWSYRLVQNFGNPLFPLANNIFRSPEFITEPLRLVRFIPANISEALWRPFAMLDPAPLVHEEQRAPDGRYALLIILVCALGARWLWRRISRPQPAAESKPAADARILAALGCGLAIEWILWLTSSGNSRYFLPMACVSAVLIVALLSSLVGDRARLWTLILAGFCGLQVFQFWMNPGYLRWTAFPWDNGPWLQVEVPKELATEPALFLSIGSNSNAYLAQYVARESGFINFTGAYPLGPSGASGERVEALIHRYAPHLRFLVQGERLYSDLKHLPNVSDVDGALGRFGLRTDPEDCTTITVVGARATAYRPTITTSLVSCRVVPDPTDHSAQVASQRAADVVLDRLEDACPELFQPRRPLTELRNGRWQRIYLNTDLFAWVSLGWVKIRNPVSGDGPTFLGSEDDWLKAPQPLVCRRRNGHDFIRVLPPVSH